MVGLRRLSSLDGRGLHDTGPRCLADYPLEYQFLSPRCDSIREHFLKKGEGTDTFSMARKDSCNVYMLMYVFAASI